MSTANTGTGTADRTQTPAPQDAPMVPAVFEPPTTPPPAAETPPRWPWVLGAVVAVAVAALGYFQPWVDPLPVVAVETVTPGPVTRVLAVNGRIAGERSVELRPQVSGTLAEVVVDEGQQVAAGQTLLRIDAAAQQAVVRQAMAGLDVAQVAEAEAKAAVARTRAMGDNATAVDLQATERAAQTAAQEVLRATAVLDQAQIQLQKFTIRAPLDGTVLALTAEAGQIVDPAMPLLTIADLDRLVVETDVDETHATQIRQGQPAALQLTGEAQVRPGHVSFVSQEVNPATGGLAVKLLAEAALSAPIGLTVTANITVDDRADAITVPRAALLRDGQGDAVLVVDEGVARQRPVTVIEWPAARLIVTEGLAAGEVVVADATGLVDGQAVSVAP